MAGYSGTPLVKKLGLKEKHAMCVLDPPDNYFELVHPLPPAIEIKQRLAGQFDVIHLFVKNNKGFEKSFVTAKKFLKKEGMLWVSWPKKSAGLATDLDENIIRAYGLRQGLVDVKVCAVDEAWSALKFVFRLKDR